MQLIYCLMVETNDINMDDVRASIYTGKLQIEKKRRKMPDDELLKVAKEIKGQPVSVAKLKKAIGHKLSINDRPKRTPFNSQTLKRLSEKTGEEWHQETLMSEDGKERLVRLYTKDKHKK
jgi:hypothetical protein